MKLRDLHVHTTFSDGSDTPEEMLRAAVAMGLETIGFADHAHTAFDESWCMASGADTAYRAEISRLKKAYADQIEVLCGIEQDLYSDTPTDGYDFVIGSVHYLCRNGVYIPVDESPELLRAAADTHFGGDMYSLCEAYYQAVSELPGRTGATVIGHFDLITKFLERAPLFSPAHARYRAAWRQAANRLLESGLPFEINTGAISRGYRTEPYPAAEIRAYLRARGARFLLSGDSHSANTLCFRFADYAGEV